MVPVKVIKLNYERGSICTSGHVQRFAAMQHHDQQTPVRFSFSFSFHLKKMLTNYAHITRKANYQLESRVT